MPMKHSDDRSLVARIAAAERWGRTADRTQATAAARSGLRAKFEREADPEGVLPPAERACRADSLVRAHMLRMSLKAKASRRKGAALMAEAVDAEAELEALGGTNDEA